MDSEPTTVQPAESQIDAGQGSESSGLYDLSSIPEQFRPSVEPVFKQWESNVTKKFQEHADYRKQWEPYEELGVSNVSPEDLQSLLAFNEMAGDDEAFNSWLAEAALERGILPQEEEFGFEDEGAGQNFDPSMIQQMIAEQVGPLYEQAQAQQYEVAVQSAADDIQTQLDGLHSEHGDFPDEIICQLAMAYDTPDGVTRAFSDYQNLIAQTERGVVENKLSEPSAPEFGGANTTSAPEINTWDEARQAAIAKLRASRQ